ncbi:hypothetical protein PQR14_03675 [Paraburkholderia bryophila]|uniref:hypothetical protein n=1 Tax=Burkholderiaceae TaxID=119060 RepID=UPI00055799CC|nr:hypothetical protein [Burkholderia sp. 9120]
MDFVFGFAGIPDEVLDGVRKERQSIVGQSAGFFTVQHGPNGTPYQHKHLTRTTNQFAEHLKAKVPSVKPDASIALFYVQRDGMNADVLEAALFPHVFMVPIDWSMTKADKHGVGQSKNELVQKLRLVCTEVRKALPAIKREFSEGAQRTPLLLPYRNFESRHLLGHLKYVQSSLLAKSDKFTIIEQAVAKFRHLHPPQKIQEGHKAGRRYFVDARGIQFKPPGHELHGLHHPSGEHNEICYISAKRRLGAAYNPTLHYDCQKGEPFSALFFDCHENKREALSVKKHINIAPNDNIRLSS